MAQMEPTVVRHVFDSEQLEDMKEWIGTLKQIATQLHNDIETLVGMVEDHGIKLDPGHESSTKL